ncbi:MAG TPA: trehalose-6-phosphate synthase [Planctomycetota bacterium]|nr:trehalose-6-phosphate synthase [Planctomycetota bacterium]
MSRAVRVVLLLVAVLGGLTFAAALLVQAQTRAWYSKDLNLRARLAVSGARAELSASWRNSPDRLLSVLSDLAQNERIMGACACSMGGENLVHTTDYPAELPCATIVQRVRRDGPDPDWGHWMEIEKLPSGDVHLSALPISDAQGDLGFIVLAQDMSFVARRETAARQFLLVAFGVLSVLASVVTFMVTRLSWSDWSAELRQVLRGGNQRKEFQPILSDVRELVDRLMDQEGRSWTPERLKETLRQRLSGERVIVLANREPYLHRRGANGEIIVMHPASGLVTALEPILRACSGTWIAHGSGPDDRETADRHGRLRVPPAPDGGPPLVDAEGTYVLRRVWLSNEEEKGYYYGFSNEGLWPLCHIAHARPLFRSDDWEYYRSVNEKFVRAVLDEVDSDDPIVLVQDYHFALAPAMIRRVLPKATVIAFWHIPWPNAELFGICPYRNELLEGLLGASILGFHTQFHCNNFLDAVDRFLEARIDRERSAVVHRGHESLVQPYPISVEWPMRKLAGVPPAAEARASVFEELGLGTRAKLGVGVDRLDYTKGIEERLLAVERLFERHPEHIGRFTFVQLAAPSRTTIERYQQLNDHLEAVASRIDERFARDEWHPVVLRRSHHEPPEVFRFLRASDLCYVSSLHDGMNLVAKEFVAAREDERGVLILSQFTGAARELTEALVVNPYNLDEAADALHAALEMPAEEQAARLRAMRSYLAEFNVYRWAGRMLIDASRLRRRERLIERLSESGNPASLIS